MISFKSERTRHRIGCGEGVYCVGMGAGGQWAAGEGVADGAHGFRVVKISVVLDVIFCFRSQNSDASLYLKHWYSFYIRVEYQRLHENNLTRRRQLK